MKCSEIFLVVKERIISKDFKVLGLAVPLTDSQPQNIKKVEDYYGNFNFLVNYIE